MQHAPPYRGRIAFGALVAVAIAALILAGAVTWRGRSSPAASAYERGRALAAAGMNADARELYQQALRLDPAFAPPHRGLAELAEADRDWPAAIPEWQAYLARERRPVHGWCALAGTELRLGMLTSAQRDAERELALDPHCGTAHFLLGLLYEHRAAPYQSVQHMAEAARLLPYDARVQCAYGRVLCRSNSLPAALAALQQAEALDTARPETARWLGAVYARLPASPENARLAEESLRHALRLRPDYAEAAYELGSLCFSQGRTREALAMTEQAVRQRPHYLHALYLLVKIDRALGRTQEADSRMREFRQENDLVLRTDSLQIQYKRDPTNAGTALALGRTLLARDQPAEAVRYLTDAARHNPRDSRLQAALAEAQGALASREVAANGQPPE